MLHIQMHAAEGWGTTSGHHHPFNTTNLETTNRGDFSFYAMEAANEQLPKQLNWRQKVLLLACLHLHNGNNDEKNR